MTDPDLSLRGRAECYNLAFPQFPDSHLHVGRRMICGTWLTGNDYKNRSKLYGAYPRGYLDRILTLFPDVPRPDTLHLFSGSVKPDEWVRFDSVDRNPVGETDNFVLGDAEQLSTYFPADRFQLVLADPPYSPEDAKEYQTPMPNVRIVMHELAKVVRTGGFVVWLSTSTPMFDSSEWALVGAIGLIRSTNHRDRIIKLFERV